MYYDCGSTLPLSVLDNFDIAEVRKHYQLPNLPPTARFTMSAGNQSVNDGGSLKVTADETTGQASVTVADHSSDSDGLVVEQRWTLNGEPWQGGAGFTGRFPVGMYTLSLIVTDDDGAASLQASGAVIVSSPGLPPIVPETVNIRAYIDGRSRLILQGNSVRWYHLDFAAPGRELFTNQPTTIDGVNWYPTWPDVPDNENRFCACSSSTYAAITPPIPAQDMSVSLELVRARTGFVSIVEYPSVANGYSIVIDFDDNPVSHSDWYEVNVRIGAPEPPGPPPPSPPPAPVTSATVLLTQLDEASGQAVADASGYVNDGTATGTTITSGMSGMAREFGGADTVAIPDSPSLRITGELTIDAWIAPIERNGIILSKWGRNGYSYLLGYWCPGNRIWLRVSEDGGGEGRTLWSTRPVLPHTGWHHVTAVFKPSTYMKIWIDGVEDASSLTSFVPASIHVGSNPVVIGAEGGGYPDGGTYFGGSIDELRLARQVLTPEGPNDWTIVPGYRVGPVFLGMGGDTVRSVLGAPDQIVTTGTQEFWYYFGRSILIAFQSGVMNEGVSGVKCYGPVWEAWTGRTLPGFTGTVLGTTIGPMSSNGDVRQVLGVPDEEQADRCWYHRLGISFIYGDSLTIGLPDAR
jgi:hypothetical protein